MGNPDIIRSLYNDCYAFSIGTAGVTTPIKPIAISDINSSVSFIRGISASSETWQRLASRCDNFRDWRNQHLHDGAEKFVAEMLARGLIKAYAVNEQAVILANIKKSEQSPSYALVHPSVLLTKSVVKKFSFFNASDVKNALALLDIKTEHLEALAKFLPLKSVVGDSVLAQVQQKLLRGELLLVELRRMIPIRSRELAAKFSDVRAVYEAANTATTLPSSVEVKQPVELKLVVNNQAQVQRLKRAAETGSPYCEICPPIEEKNPIAIKKSNPTAVNITAKAQAKTLQRAAKEGAAFCEVC